MNMKYKVLQDFLDQDDITLVTEPEGTPGLIYWKQAPINSTERQIIDQTQLLSLEDHWPSNCFDKTTQYTGKHASICDTIGIKSLLSEEFSKNGKCNWYTLNQDFFQATLVMAFQVFNH